MERLKIEEIIVVEGKDDVSAVKKAVDAQILVTNGYSLDAKQRDLIRKAGEKKNIIVLTDSDYAGEVIRKRVEKLVGSQRCKHAFIPKEQSIKNGDIGVENANEDSIVEALTKITKKDVFTVQDMFAYGLQGQDNSSEKRDKLGKILGIGYCNSKQFLSRLNNFDITYEEFIDAISKIQ